MVHRTAAAALMLMACACSIFEPSGRERDLRAVDRHHDLWQAQQIHSYAFEYSRACFCPPDLTTRVRIDVRADTILRVTNAQTGAEVTHLQYARWPTIDSLFAGARRTISSGDWKYEIEYDPTLGYMRRLSGDIPNTVDDEFVETVHSFIRNP